MENLRIAVLLIFGAALSSCSSSSSNNDDAPLTGVFIDSAVQGLDYTAGSLSGTTDADGTFEYKSGDTIEFSVGALIFPSVSAGAMLSPIDMAQGANSESDVIVNIARLIQSLDSDGDTSNGISIPATAKDVATALDFDVPATQFAENADVINLIANSGSVTTSIVSAEAALDHLYDSLGIPNPDNTDVASLAGFWNSDADEDFILISDMGEVTFYDNDIANSCYTTRSGMLTQIQDTLYLLESDGDSTQVVLTRTGNSLNVLLIGTFTLETTLMPSELTGC